MGLKTLQNNLRIGMSYLYLFLSFSFFFLSQHDIYGQCTGGTENAASPLVSNGGSQMVNMFGDEYVRIYLCGGEEYTFTTCGEADFNTEITLRSDDDVTQLAYDNDGCGTDQATITYTPPSDGFIRVLLHNYIVGIFPLPDLPCQTSLVTTPLTITQNTGTGCAPIGFNCTSPYLLTDANIGTAITGLTTDGFGDDYSTSPCTDMTNIEGGAAAANDYMGGNDFVFTYTPSTTDCYLFSATNTDDFAGIFVLDDCPDVATTCLGVAGSSDNTTHVSASLTGGTQYYIVVSSWPAPQETAFDFLISSCDGMDCANPYVLAGGAPITQAGLTTEGYGNDYSATPCADDDYIGGEDFIIEFTPTATGCHNIALSNTDTFVGVYVLDGCPDNGATTCIGSASETGGNPGLNVALTAATTYTIVVSTFPAPDFTPFDIAITECSNTGANCSQPYAITAPSLPHTESNIDLCGLASDYDDTDACGNFYMYGEDIVMTYTPTTTDCYSFALSGTPNSDPLADIGLFILTGCPDDPATICVSQETADNSFPTANANLTANEEYYIVVAASDQAAVVALNSCTEFNLTINDGATGCPAGATCSDPYIITAPSFPHVEAAIDLCGLGNDYGQADACSSLYMFGEDIVMTFTPTATDCYSIALSGTPNSDPIADIGMFIMTGCPDDPQTDCIVQEEVDNSFPTIDIYMDASVTYYIVIAASEQAGPVAVNSCTEFDLTINNGSLNCPAGPSCANPIVITPPSFPYTEAGLNSCGTGNDYDNTDACGSTYMNGEDIVLTFTPTVTDCYNFTANNISNAAADMGLFVLNGCPDDLTTSCIGQDEVDNGSPTTDAYLNAGVTYYIVVSAVEFVGPIANSSCTAFDLVIANGALNCPGGAVCSNPYVITAPSFPHTEAGLTSCGFGNDYDNGDACASDYMEGEDFVMTFTPTTTDCYNFAVANTTPDTDVGLFVLTDCPDSGSASCIAQDEVDNGGPTTDAYLTAGETYYIVVSAIEYDFLGLTYTSSCTDFDLTINTGGTNCPFGAICSNSDVIPSLPYSQTGLTTCGFGDDYDSADGCGSVYMNGDDYVFSFTPTVTDCYNIDITNTGNNPTGLFVLDNCPDALAANCVAINEDDDVDGEPSVTTDLQAGVTYYIVVSTNAALIGGVQCTPFDISMTQGCPTGTTCASANVIASSPAAFPGLTSCGAGYDYDDTEGCGGNYMTGEDYVFEFTPSATECYLLSLSNATDATADWGLSVTDGCPDDPTATCVGQITADNNTPGIDLNLTAGTTYYIVIDTWSAPDCSGFDFNIAACPASVIEQDCIGAIPVCQDTYNQPNSYVGEGDFPNEINSSNSCLFDGERNDVWYLITIQSDGNFNFEIQPANVDDDYDWAVYDLTNNVCSDIFSNPGIEISCNYSLLPGTTGTSNASIFTSQGSAGTTFNAPIPVLAGDILVLNISNFSSTQDGYFLDLNPALSPSTAGIFDNVAAEFSAVDPNIPCGATTIDVTFSDPVLCNTVEACDFELTGPGGPYTITAVSGGNCTDPGNADLYERDFTLTIDPPLIASGDFTIALVTPVVGTCGSITDKCGNVASNGENIAFTLDNVSASITAQTDANCGDSSGSVTVAGANGTAPYEYALDGGTFQSSGTFTGLAGGTYIVTTLDDIGCAIDVDVTIIDNGAIPDATASNDSPVCEGGDVNLTSNTTTIGTTTTYIWAGPNTFSSGDQNPVISGATTADAGIYTVTITVDGCSATATTAVSINPLPTPSFTLSDTEVCADGSSIITVTYTGSASTGATYTWSFGGGDATPGTGQGPHDITWSSGTGSMDITLEVTENGCTSAVETQSVTLSEPLEAPSVTCPGSTENSVDFDWQDVTGATGYDISYTINSGTATDILNHPDSDYQVTGLSPGDQVDISVIALGPAPCGNSAAGTGNCDAQDCPTVTVSIDNLNAAYCVDEAAFALQGTPSGGTFSGTGVSGGQFDPAAAGVGGPYTITYDYTDSGTGCDYSTTGTVTVNAVPTSTFTLSDTQVCADGNGTTTVTYTGSAGTGATYNWNFGGGSATPGTGQGPHSVTWSSGTGSVDITLEVTENDCTSAVETQSVTLSEPLETPNVTCPGSTETSVDFDWQDVTGATGYDISYTINSGTATDILNHPNSDYQVSGLTAGDQVDITVIALGPAPCGNSAAGIGNCDAESCPTVTVTIDNLNAAYCEDEAAFALQGTPSGGTFSGTGVSGGQFDPAAAGVGGPYTITYDYTDSGTGCDYSTTGTVTVNAVPTSTFTLSDTQVCADGTSTITVTYTGNAGTGATYNWNFGGGSATPSTGQGPHSVTWSSGTGSVDITLEVTENGCTSAVETQSITLSEPLQTPNVTCPGSTENSVDFDWQDVTGATGYDISYTINSGTATDINNHPNSDYQVSGLTAGDQVDITVIALGPAPCGNSAIGTGNCDAESCPTVTVTIDNLNAAYCEDEAAFALQGTPSGGTFSGTGVSGGQFDPAAAGVGGPYTITYDYTDSGTGCDYSTTGTVTVNAVPTSTFTLSDTEVCADGTSAATVTYTGSAGTGATYNWSFGGGNASPGSGQGPHSVTWSSGTGSVDITLEVTENGCTSVVATQSITLSEPLVVPNISCSSTPNSVSFNWQDIAGATGYTISYTINGGSPTNTSSGTSDFDVNGLNPLDEVDITVTANGPAPCGDGPVGTGNCIAEDCPTVISIDNLAGPYCTDDSAFPLQGTPSGGSFSGPGVSGGQFDPSSAGVGTHTLTYEVTEGSCTYTTTEQVTVNGVPTSTFTVSESELCADGTSTTTVSYTGSAGTGATYNWNFGGGNASPGTGQGPHTVTWSSGTGLVNLSLTVTENGCTSGLETQSVTLSEPLATPVIVCGTVTTSEVNFDWQDVTGATSYDISYTINGGIANTDNSPPSTYQVTGLTAGDEVIITVIAIGNGPCGNSATGTGTCTAEDCPVISLSINNLNATYCENESAFSLQGTPSGGTFSGPGVSGGEFAPGTAGVGGPYTITYDYTDPGTGCDYQTTADVSVNPQPTSTFTISEALVCSDGTSEVIVTHTGNAPPGSTYNWNFGGGNASPGTGQGPHTVTWSSGTGAANITLTVSANGCDSGSSSQQVSLSAPLASPNISCTSTPNSVSFDWQDIAGATGYTLSYTVNGGTPTNASSGTSDFEITGLNPLDEVVITVTANGPAPCGDSAASTGNCTAEDCPTLISIDSQGPYCSEDGAISLVGSPSGGIFSGPGVSGGQFDPGTAGPGTHTISYDVTEGDCDYSITKDFVVNESPTSDFSLSATEICADGTSSITVSYTGNAGTGATYNWNFGSATATPGGTTQGPHTLSWNSGTGSVNIVLSVSENGCSSASTTQSVTLSEPLATPVVNCGVLTTSEVNFDWSNIPGSTGYDISYTINGGTATNDNTGSSDYQVTGLSPNDEVVITVIALGPAPCGNSAAGSGTCTAQDCPTNITPSITNLNATYCEDDGAFTLQATPAGGTFSGTGVSGAQFNPGGAGVGGPYTITYDYTDPVSGCDYQTTGTVSVNAVPTSDFNLSDSQVCADGSSIITVNYTGTAGIGASYNWNFGGGDASPGTGAGPHTVTWASGSGSANITLTVSENGCESDISSQSVTLSAPLATPNVSCTGSTTATVDFDWADIAGASGYSISYTVNSGGATTDNTSTSDYQVGGLNPNDEVTITIVALGTAPCGDSAAGSSTCIAQDCPTVNLSIDNLSPSYCTNESAFILQGTPAGGIFSGIGVTGGQFDPSVGAGTYSISYDYTDAPSGCAYSTSQQVTVNNQPSSDFSVNPSDVCADGIQSTTVTYTGTAGTGASYNWNFGGGSAVPGTGQGPHTVTWSSGSGSVNISLTVTTQNGCSSPESSQSVTLFSPLPIPVITCGTTSTSEVNFDWADIAGATGYTISYTINNGPASNANSASSDFQVTGLSPNDEVTIIVIANGPAPCGDSASGTGTCIAEDCPSISPSISGLNASYCADAGSVALIGTPAGGVFSGTGVSGSNFDPASAGAGGPYTLTYDYTDAASGCAYQATTTVSVNAVPTASFSVSPDPICADGSSVATVTFTGTAAPGASYNWNFGGGNASPGGNVAGPHIVTWDSGTGAVNLSLAISQNGCVSPEATQSVTLAEPLAAPSVNCTGSTTSSVSFDWGDIAGATSYDISYTINGGAAINDNTVASNFDVPGLTVNDEVVISVIAVGPAPCGNSAAGTAQCEALDCPTQNLTITGLNASYCADAAAIPLTGTPAGGTFSGTGVNSATSTFNPGNAGVGGPYTITYSYIDPANPDCDYSTTSQVTVRAVPTSDFVINPSDVCADGLQSATVTYTGSAGTGATYNWNFGGGTAVPGGNVQGPHTVTWASGSGSVAISLSVTANSCSSEPSSQNVNLSSPLASPIVSCGSSTTNSVTFDWADITGSTGYEVTYTINGGTVQNDNTATSSYTVNGLSVNDEVTLSVIAVGPAPCGNSAAGSQTCTAEDCPDLTPTIGGLASEYCSDEGVIALIGTPVGGTFSGPGISGNNFDPANAGTGLISIVYDYQEGDCSYTTSTTTTISQPLTAPTVTCGTTTTTSIVFNWTAVAGATGYNITLSGAAVDNQTTANTSFTVNGLSVNDEVTIVVEPIGGSPCGNGPTGTATCTAEDCPALPSISIDNLNAQYCADDVVVATLLATPPGGEFSGAGVVGNSFDPSAVGAASTTVIYTYTDPANPDCDYQTTFQVTILPPYDAPVVTCGTSTTSSVTFNWNNVGTNDYVVSYTIDAGAPTTENVTGTTFTVGSLTTGSSVTISVTALGVPPCGDSPSGTATCIAEDCAVINPTITGLNNTYCSDEGAVNLTLEPAGGILSGPGTSGSSFNPSTAGTGLITLTYDYTDPATDCSYQTTASTTLSIPLSAPTVTCGTTTTNSIVFNWSSVPGASDYNLSWSGAATGNQTVTGTSFELTGLSANDVVTLIVEPIGLAPCGNGPSGTATCTANDCPVVAIDITGLAAQYCGDEGAVTLSANPAGGTFSGPGVSGNSFDPSAAGQASVTIVYDYTDPSDPDCSYQQTASTTVLPPYGVPTVECGTSTTSSVTFTWADVGSASYQVTLSGAVTNSFTTGGTSHTESGLNEGDAVTITVVALGEAPCGDSQASTITCTAEACQPVGISINGLDALYCRTDGLVSLTGTPAGGVFVGPGITGNSFDPSLAGVGGPYTILYDYTDPATACEYQASATVSVNAPLATPTVICSDEDLNSVSFDWDAIAGASQYEITVSINSVPSSAQITTNTDYTESGLAQNDVVDISVIALGSPPCGNSAAGTAQCTARDCPDVTLTLDIADQYCGNEAVATLTPDPSGGTLSGPGITGNTFDPAGAGVGSHNIVYSLTDAEGCVYQETFETEVLPPLGTPTVSCGTISPNSITFNWLDVGSTDYEVTITGAVDDMATVNNTSYTVTGLSAGESVTIEVIALGADCGDSAPSTVSCTTGDCDVNLSIVGLDAEYCSDAGDVVLSVVDASGNVVTGGIFSGDGIVGGLFRPSQAGTGNVTISYSYTDPESGCPFTTSLSTSIAPALNTPTVICAGTTVTNVAFSWDDVGADMYNIVVTVNGTQTDNLSASTLSFDKTGLTAGDEVGISVVAVGTAPCGDSEAGTASCTAQDCSGPTPTIDNLSSEYCGASSSTFTLQGTPSGGTFSGPGVTGDTFDPSAVGQQNVTIVYTFTDSDGCVYQTTGSTQVLPPFDVPTIACAAVTTSSVSVEWEDVGSAQYELTIQVNGGTPTSQTVSGTSYTESNLNVGDEVTITVVAVGVSACGDSDPSTTSCIAADCPDLTLAIEGLAEAYCTGDEAVSLTATLDGTPVTSGNFIGAAISGANTLNPALLPGGLYLISYVYNEPNGCQYIATESVSIGGVTGEIIGVSSPISVGSIAPLSVNAVSVTGGNLTYEWSPIEGLDCTDCESVNATPTQTTTYEVLVSDSEGCNRVFSTTVEVSSESDFVIPSAFTPNGDGFNDVYAPEAEGFEEITFQIFNRWGEKLHDVTSNDMTNIGWDGTYKDEPMPIGSYVYVVIVVYRDGEQELEKGSFQLLR